MLKNKQNSSSRPFKLLIFFLLDPAVLLEKNTLMKYLLFSDQTMELALLKKHSVHQKQQKEVEVCYSHFLNSETKNHTSIPFYFPQLQPKPQAPTKFVYHVHSTYLNNIHPSYPTIALDRCDKFLLQEQPQLHGPRRPQKTHKLLSSSSTHCRFENNRPKGNPERARRVPHRYLLFIEL